MLLAAFSLSGWPPAFILPTAFQANFDAGSAERTAETIALQYPDRRPGGSGAEGAATFVGDELSQLGYRVTRDAFTTTVAGLGRRTLVNVRADAPGRSRDAIVVLAHRDDAGGAGLDDNASGTAILLELARIYGVQPGGGRAAVPDHTIIFLSTDGGSYGAGGAERFAQEALGRQPVLAAVALDAVAGAGRLRVVLASDTPSSPDQALVSTARESLAASAPAAPLQHASPEHQLLDLAFPFSLYEQAPFTARGTPAIALTTATDRPPPLVSATTTVRTARLREVGRTVEQLVARLDNGASSSTATRTYIAFNTKLVPGWAIQLLLLSAVLPAFVAIVDLFARCRRRHLALGPALRSLRARAGFWLFALVAFELLVLARLFPHGAARPVSPETHDAQHWPLGALTLLALAVCGGWLVSRQRLIPQREATGEEELAGHVAGLLGLLVIAVLLVALNRYALVFVLPSLHAWLWLPQLRHRRRWLRLLVFGAGLLGPLWLVHAFATRLALGFDTPWYLMELAVVRYVSLPLLVVFTAWLAVAGQLLTLTVGRYAPYPLAEELPPRGPVRESVRRLALAGRALHEVAAPAARRRAEGE